MKKYCVNCKQFKETSEFEEREDRDCLYAWCRTCMEEWHRFKGYPSEKDRGGGTLASVEDLFEN